VVQAHLLAADNLLGTADAGGRAFFIGQEKPVFLWDWINGLFAAVGIEQVQKKVPFAAAFAIGSALECTYTLLKKTAEPPMTRFVSLQLAKSHWFSQAAAGELLGYVPEVSIEEGMKLLVPWISGASQG